MGEQHTMLNVIRFRGGAARILVNQHNLAPDTPHYQGVRGSQTPPERLAQVSGVSQQPEANCLRVCGCRFQA